MNGKTHLVGCVADRVYTRALDRADALAVRGPVEKRWDHLAGTLLNIYPCNGDGCLLCRDFVVVAIPDDTPLGAEVSKAVNDVARRKHGTGPYEPDDRSAAWDARLAEAEADLHATDRTRQVVDVEGPQPLALPRRPRVRP